MRTIKKPMELLLPWVLAGGLLGSAAHADEELVIDLAKIDCRSMLKMDNDERDFTMIFFHGMMSGKNNEMTFDGLALSEVTDKVLDHCIDNPKDMLISVFEKYRGKSE